MINKTTTATEVDKVVSDVIDTWNRHDMTAHTALFHPDADFVNVLGKRLQGRKEIDEIHHHLHRTIFRNTVLRSEGHTVRFLTPTIALVHVNWEMTGAEGLPGWQPAAVRHGLMTWVLVEENGKWLITAAHNTDTVPIAMPK
jgi:uncharacterized protein (TIGR02246 family)